MPVPISDIIYNGVIKGYKFNYGKYNIPKIIYKFQLFRRVNSHTIKNRALIKWNSIKDKKYFRI